MDNRDVEPAEMVSQLMARAATDAERRAIALLGDKGFFDDVEFRLRCVRPRGEGVNWRRVQDKWVHLPENDPRRAILEDSALMANLARAHAPESLEELQVRIDLDGASGIVLAAWRDFYAADPREPSPYHHHIDLCVDELRRRFECWNCGRSAAEVTTHDLPVCSTCRKRN
jgi:hypothetical protein